ncbi:MAG: hypothetical protein JJU02_12215 [Cryomorphaceae bacterium]|nr:hypothetical protein [Cryomorphaceae bacterium]
MKNTTGITMAALLLLTLLSAIFAPYSHTNVWIRQLILLLALNKFLLVAWVFMEIHKAHGFWKFCITFLGIIICGAIGIVV